MRLKDYFAAVAEVIARHKTDAEIGDALAEGHGMPGGAVDRHFDRVLNDVRDALNENKRLLGVLEDNGNNAANRRKIVEKEIERDNLRIHLVAVRQSLKHYAELIDPAADPIKQYDSPGSIMVRVLNDITSALGVKVLGSVFGPTERDEYQAHFGRTEAPVKFSDTIPQVGTPEYERFAKAVMERLRREGKIK